MKDKALDLRPDSALSDAQAALIDRYWRAANYLSVGQIYLLDNPLLREPLAREHVKPRLLGHWGTTPGLNFIYAHLNRIIRARGTDVLYVCGPGHGGPAMVANTWLEGTYSEIYPDIGDDEDGMRRLFRQFSFPGGIPSHASPDTPGSIHEGGELGYALVHAYGAAFDNPDLVVACVVGDGEAETGALAASWHSNKFLNPVRDGAVRRYNGSMSTVPIEEIRRDVFRYFSQVEAGERLVVTRAGKPIAEIMPAGPTVSETGDEGPASQDSGLRPIGLAEGLFIEASDFDEPLPEELLRLFEGQ